MKKILKKIFKKLNKKLKKKKKKWKMQIHHGIELFVKKCVLLYLGLKTTF